VLFIAALRLWGPGLDQRGAQFLRDPAELHQRNGIVELPDDGGFSGCVEDGCRYTDRSRLFKISDVSSIANSPSMHPTRTISGLPLPIPAALPSLCLIDRIMLL
jgi:hypothetical protein